MLRDLDNIFDFTFSSCSSKKKKHRILSFSCTDNRKHTNICRNQTFPGTNSGRNLSRESLFKEPCEKYLQPQLCERPRGAAHVDWALQSLRRLREPGLGGACATGLGAVALGARNPAPLPWGNASKEGA